MDKNPTVFEQALVEAQVRLYEVIYALMAGDGDAMNVLQETNAAILRRKGDYNLSRPLFPLFKKFAVTQVACWREQHQRDRLVFDSELAGQLADAIAQTDSSEETVQEERDFVFLRECLKKLPDGPRKLLEERYFDNRGVDEIARENHISENSLSVLFYRVRRSLKDCIEKARTRFEKMDTDDPRAPFARLLERLLDGKISEAERADLYAMLKSDAALREAYLGQTRLSAALRCHNRRLFKGGPAKPTFRVSARLAAMAAAFVALLAGGAFLARRGKPHPAPLVPVAETRRIPVSAGSRQAQPDAAIGPVSVPPPAVQAAAAPPPPVPKPAVAPAPVVVTNQTIAVARPQRKEEKMNAAVAKLNTLAATATVAAAVAVVPPNLMAQLTDIPVVSNVTFKQPFNSRVLEIGYTLANGPGIVTVDITTNGVSIGDANLTYFKGEINKLVTNGTYTIFWDTKKAWPDHTNLQARAVVTAWATNCPPDYLVADLVAGTNIHYYTSVEALPDGGISNTVYKTTRIVMRKIPAAGVTWTMGSSGEFGARSSETPHNVTLPQDYYIGIFEVTQAQWALLKGARPSYWNNVDDYACRPVERVSFYGIRESTDNSENTACQYPNPPHPQSFLGLLRAKTGLPFDLPGEAEWELACRGTTGDDNNKWGDGSSILSDTHDTHLDLLARYEYTGGRIVGADGSVSNAPQGSTAEYGSAIVGSYRPNGWGIYDMHGNVYEFCLDWFTRDISELNGAVNTNMDSSVGKKRIIRGGSFGDPALGTRSAARVMGFLGTGNDWAIGLRVVSRLDP